VIHFLIEYVWEEFRKEDVVGEELCGEGYKEGKEA